MRRWLKAGALEDGVHQPSEEGTPQGGSISVLLSNVYLHYVLDLWFERVVKPRLQGEAYMAPIPGAVQGEADEVASSPVVFSCVSVRMVRYLDDFVVCFQCRADALRVQGVLRKRLAKFNLTLEPNWSKRNWFDPVLARNRRKGYKVGIRTEKSRVRRTLATLRGPDAADAALAGSRAGPEPEPPLAGALCVLRGGGELPRPAAHRPRRRALLAQAAQQPESQGAHPLGRLSPDTGEAPVTATTFTSPASGAASTRCAVNQFAKSGVREIRTLRSVGAGGG